MRVLCMLREIQEELGLTMADLERELGMDSRSIDKLIEDSDSDPWRLDRENLHRFLLFAHSHGFDGFQIEPNSIWRTFENQRAVIFRGPTKADVPVESHLVKYFERLNCEVESAISSEGIEEAMRERNCVVIGSPKANPASEVALALLWGAEPFIGEAPNREKIPISFFGMQREGGAPSALLQQSTRYGFHILPPGATERKYLKVDWLPPEKFGPYKGTGQEAAILVGCNRPLGSQKDVTTIVVAGYTGLSTLVAAQEATSKPIPELQLAENPGQPCLAVLKLRYRKRRQYRQALANLRTPEEGSAKWAPPWPNFFS